MNSLSLRGFIDIHSHLLPGLDDGPQEFAQSLVAAERYQAIGVTSVIATPHWIQGSAWAPAPGLVRDRAAETEHNIRAAGIPLRLLPGMEIALTDFLCCNFALTDFVSLGGSGLFLVEFPLNSALNAPSREALRKLVTRMGKNRFIIAHPERCAMFQKSPDLIRELVEEGMLTQVNISSVLGCCGQGSLKTAFTLLNNGLVHFLGTDSHASVERMPPTPSEMVELTNRIGVDAVTSGFRDNPLRLLSGETVAPLQFRLTATGGYGGLPQPKGVMQSLLQLFREH